MRLLLLLCLVSVIGCFDKANPYGCTNDKNCDTTGQGVCTSAGDGMSYCAYADPICMSRLRWSVDAVDHLAGTCVLTSGVDAGLVDLSMGHPTVAAFKVIAANAVVEEHQNFKVHIIAVDAFNVTVGSYAGTPQLVTDWGNLHISAIPVFVAGEAD